MIRVEWDPDDPFLTVSFRYYPEAFRTIAHMPATKLVEQNGKKVWRVPVELYGELYDTFPGEVVGPPVWKVLGQDPPPPPAWWREIEPLLDHPIPDLKLPLYPYQVRGANFAAYRLRRDRVGFIWDSMGLGKTPASMGVILLMRQQGLVRGPVLYVTLASLRRQTVTDGFVKFTHLAATFVDSDMTAAKRRKVYAQAPDYDALVVGYENGLHDFEDLAKLKFSLVVLDEIHKLKNRQGKIYKAWQKLIGQWQPYLLGLTGTPVQNRAEELYSIFTLHPVGKKLLGGVTEFNERYLRQQFNPYFHCTEILGYQHLDELAAKVSPFYIRRERNDPEVKIQFPDAQTIERWVEPTKEQQELFAVIQAQYEADLTELRLKAASLTEAQREAAEKRLQGYQVLLQGAADDPALFGRSKSAAIRRQYGHYGKEGSPKREAFREIIQEQVEEGKVLVFSQFATMVQLLAEDLKKLKIGYVICTGEESDRAREEAKQQLWHDPDTKVMLATDAMAMGHNLQCCRTLINFDQPWNPTVADQRVGRIQRTGSQYSTVLVINLLCRDSIDERILEAQREKRDLASTLVH